MQLSLGCKATLRFGAIASEDMSKKKKKKRRGIVFVFVKGRDGTNSVNSYVFVLVRNR